ncbi:TPA: hypothetical protein OME37_003754 [Klebsiella michiganensis]|nr:hypothetical protein [Klebsiella michiganensis]HCU0766536.1 hypothetical protein [Klebsiella michiganensis]HEP0438350.1 hypothetical protein [Klebsiella michiganensis]HEP0463894.1 hypothetical protein [Klebsiella michiganensis]
MTNNQLAPERISDISDYFVEMQDHYSDPADRENFEIFRDAELLMKELQERRKADSEPVATLDVQSRRPDGNKFALVFSSAAHKLPDDVYFLYRHAQQPVVDADDNFYSWFGREWQENYQHNQYTTAAKQMLGVMAESAWKAGRRAAMLNHPSSIQPNTGAAPGAEIKHPSTNSPVIPEGYVIVPKEPTERMVIDGFESEPDETFSEPEVWEAFQKMSGCEQAAFRARLCWAAMLAAAPQEVPDGK